MSARFVILTDLQRRQHCVTFIQTRRDVARELHVEYEPGMRGRRG